MREGKKCINYDEMKHETARMWKMKKVDLILVAMAASWECIVTKCKDNNINPDKKKYNNNKNKNTGKIPLFCNFKYRFYRITENSTTFFRSSIFTGFSWLMFSVNAWLLYLLMPFECFSNGNHEHMFFLFTLDTLS